MRGVTVDAEGWSGEGTFTAALMGVLKECAFIETLRVEDAPATRTDVDYNFISNEIYVRFRDAVETETSRWLGIVPVTKRVARPSMTLTDLEAHLTTHPDVGAPDFADDGMLQFLRTERIVPPYQTRGYKLVELVRIYDATVPLLNTRR